MNQPVVVENDALRVEVWPQHGAKVSSVVDKADGYELLFDYPSEIPTEPQYDAPYAKAWHAGWDECFPAVAASAYSRHPYAGIMVPDHGELWGLPTTAVPAKQHGITTVWHGLRFGYRLTRKLYLDGPALAAEYTLVNLAPFDFHFVWAQHALLSLTAEARVELPPPAGGQVTPFRWSHDAEGHEFDQPFAWPNLGDGLDVSRPASLPPRQGWKLVSAEPIPASRPAVIRYPTRDRSLRIEYSTGDDLRAYWGVWVNTGGWGGHRHFAVAPTSGQHEQIDRAILDGSAARVGPAGRADWGVRWVVG